MHGRSASAAAAVVATLVAWPALGETAAMVVAVEAGTPGLDELELLPAGRTVTLGPGDRVVLAYVESCVVETLAGPGSVRIGASFGSLEGAALVDRRTVDCEGVPQAGTTAGEGGAFRSRSARAPSVEERARDMLVAHRAGREAAGGAAAEEARPPWWRRWFGGGG